MGDSEEKVLDKEEWKREVEAVINDIKDFVKEISISQTAPVTDTAIHCNLTILEGNEYCVELSAAGFRIVGNSHNCLQQPSEQFYETPYSLLNTISPLYRQSFGAALAAKLAALQEMGQNMTVLQDGFEMLRVQLTKRPTIPTDIEAASTLSYNNFMNYISQLNKICANFVDDDGNYLMFAIKENTDVTIFWKATVRIGCIKVNGKARKIESHRLLTLRQFLQVFRKIAYECSDQQNGGLSSVSSGSPPMNTPPTVAASMIMNEAACADGNGLSGDPSQEECIICMEYKTDVILSCSHGFCMPCIERWKEKERSCPICRELLHSRDDTWVLSEAPSDKDVETELKKNLMQLANPN